MQCGDGRGRTWLSETSPWFGPRSLPAIYAYSHAGPSFSLRVRLSHKPQLSPALPSGPLEKIWLFPSGEVIGGPELPPL